MTYWSGGDQRHQGPPQTRPRLVLLAIVAAVTAVVVVGILLIPGTTRTSPSGPRPGIAAPTFATKQIDAAKVAAARLHQKNQLRDLLETTLTAMAGPPAGGFAGVTFTGGVWSGSAAVNQCWRCTFGPGVAAAAVAAKTGSAAYATMARQTFDAALAHQLPSGAFVGPYGNQSIDVDTMYITTELGQIYSSLLPGLDPTRKATWSKALGAAAAYLVKNGNLAWYTNGNVNLGNAAVMAIAWKATGDQAYRASMDKAIDFAINPPQDLWPGFGLIYTRVPTRVDGSDGAGYFAESGAGGIGYDSDYTQLQADNAARLYTLTSDPRALRLMNLLLNQLLLRTDTTTWHLDISGGTRSTATGPDQWRYLTTAALAVVVWRAGRADVAGFLDAQLDAMSTNYSTENQYLQPGTWFGLGQQVASAYLIAAGN